LRKLTVVICLVLFISFMVPAAKADGPLTIKWQIKLPVSYGQFHPCMGDVDNDGVQEIVVKFGDYINVLDGRTGALKWKGPKDAGSGTQVLELADLNGDGVPEIVYCGIGLCVYARDGFGKLLWKSTPVSGEQWPGTPIVTGDVNHDGYAEVYVVTEDTTAPYSARITELDHSGNVVAKSEICEYPCWGGISLADPKYDGNFKVYLGDRPASSGPGGSKTLYPSNPCRGVSCYDANTLATIWTRPDISSSTPAPVLIDVNGDGYLEVVANNILNNGAFVLDASTGANIYNWKGAHINNHAKGTVYDVDGDGHVELISSWGYQNDPTCTQDFTVLDLVTGVIKFRASNINNYVAFPPTVGDVNGDGNVEILAATSAEDGHGTVGQGMLYVYDKNFNVIQTISGYTYGKQLWEPYCVDCDGDGFNEVLVANNYGQVWCYDTPALAPTPSMKPWSAWYSPYRQGAAVYVPPVGQRSTGTTYSLTIQAPSGSGSTNPSSGVQNYAPGTQIQVSESPVSGWQFDHWIIDGVNLGNANPLSITMDGAHTIQAVFSNLSGPLFSDGFESNNFNSWTGTETTTGETISTVNSPTHAGIYSSYFTSNGGLLTEDARCYKDLTQSTDIYSRGYFYVSQSGITSNDNRFYMLGTFSGTNSLAYAGWKMVNGVTEWCIVVKAGAGTLFYYSTTPCTLNKWYCVELHWKSDKTTGAAELFIDGIKACSASGLDTTTISTTASRAQFGLAYLYNCGPTKLYADECVVSNSYIGP